MALPRTPPLTSWLHKHQVLELTSNEIERYIRDDIEPWFVRLETELDANTKPARWGVGYVHAVHGLSEPSVDRAKRLYRRVVESRITDKNPHQTTLLSLIALGNDADPISFWTEVLAYQRARDSFARERRQLAVAGLAYQAIHYSHKGSFDALLATCRHELVDVRTEAIDGLGQIPPKARAYTKHILAELRHASEHDTAFAPRFLARGYLVAREQDVPLDHPEGTYTFLIKARNFKGKVELCSTHSLWDLNDSLQSVLHWDNDHLFVFHLNGDRKDPRFELPDSDDRHHMSGFGADPDDEPTIKLGALGFRTGHRFLYFFDFGDSHLFEIEVVQESDKKHPRAKYPRIVETKGKPPRQYRDSDE